MSHLSTGLLLLIWASGLVAGSWLTLVIVVVWSVRRESQATRPTFSPSWGVPHHETVS